MGRLEPLTSMALGRSPYEDVVYGEGEADPRAPLQMYDERGRPVNPETRRFNRDIVRAHNEVMLVIGVVEPDTTLDEARAELQRHEAHEQHDETIGRTLEWVARACELGGIWGVSGLRQRIFLYKKYSHVPFSRLLYHERQAQSLPSLWLHGLPAFVVANALDFPWFADTIMESVVAKTAFAYIQTNLKLWVFLQQTRLLPASASPWLPSWKFFIPFSSASVITPCPFPSELGVQSVAGWLANLALSTMPFMAFYLVNGTCQAMADLLYEELYDLLPNPSNSRPSRPPATGTVVQRLADDRDTEAPRAQAHSTQEPSSTTAEPSQTAAVWDLPQNTDQSNGAGPDRGQTPEGRSTTPASRSGSTPNVPTRPRSHPRRSHPSNTDDFSSDDEATEDVVSATLISFDVENHPENLDPSSDAPGVWSAELRPNPGSDSPSGRDGEDGAGGSRRQPRPPMYRDNVLTQLPASLAAGIMAHRASSLMLAPLEAASLRQVAWLWCQSHGRITDGLFDPVWFWPLVWRRNQGFHGWNIDFGAVGFTVGSVVSLVGLEMIHLLFDACLWSSVPFIVSRYLFSDEEWEKRQRTKEQREQARLQQQMDGASDGPDGGQASTGSAG